MSVLALLGGKKAKSKPFPLWPHYDEHERAPLMFVVVRPKRERLALCLLAPE